MKTAALAIALLLGGAAFAQTGTTDAPAYDGDGVTAAFETEGAPSAPLAAPAPAAAGQIVEPGNADPERDARGIAVISAPAIVPPGWNGTAGTAMGGPLLDPTTAAAAEEYPPCTAAVTDNCLQTYERGRR